MTQDHKSISFGPRGPYDRKNKLGATWKALGEAVMQCALNDNPMVTVHELAVGYAVQVEEHEAVRMTGTKLEAMIGLAHQREAHNG